MRATPTLTAGGLDSAELYGAVSVEKQVHAGWPASERFFEPESPPDYTFLLSEACLRRNIGNPAMMRTQLEHLLALSEWPYDTVLLLPFDAYFPWGRSAPRTVALAMRTVTARQAGKTATKHRNSKEVERGSL